MAPRLRIAPSPTGDPHVGLAYITLFNFIFTRQNKGTLVLRIEDTDRTRSREDSEKRIMESLQWLNLSWDEGPDKSGPYGPYRQSERREIYQKYVDILLAKGAAYPCFCSSERLDAMRSEQQTHQKSLGYDGHCRKLSWDESQSRRKQEAHTVRLKVPRDREKIFFTDGCRGSISIPLEQIDDQVLMKSDGFPTYHLANVVDDYLMKISHVMRAEEWISSTPKHIILYEALDWPLPKFFHLPLLRSPDRGKISKRKNPTGIEFYRRRGILPEAFLNFLALMGWSYGDNREIFSLEDMLEHFRVEDLHLGGPVFDFQKLLWINQNYIQKMGPKAFSQYLRSEIFSENYLENLYPLVKDRLVSFDELTHRHETFFRGLMTYDYTLPQDFLPILRDFLSILDELYTWTAPHLHEVMEELRKKHGLKGKEFYWPIRWVCTGRGDTPPLPETLAFLGREIVRFRLREALR